MTPSVNLCIAADVRPKPCSASASRSPSHLLRGRRRAAPRLRAAQPRQQLLAGRRQADGGPKRACLLRQRCQQQLVLVLTGAAIAATVSGRPFCPPLRPGPGFRVELRPLLLVAATLLLVGQRPRRRRALLLPLLLLRELRHEEELIHQGLPQRGHAAQLPAWRPLGEER